ncbi:hypothetical protein EXIGLDRAFT_838222 [Exidia glandulosa HHB12029]|uniref:Zn(2)-C6 fungal-type domain-containing protein n=1 Tax=Exidia glandulosa HHB12029 TaxID=1314781 RepID=A0A165G2W6_EXIGL|nr:hypothetical protein EXIGLDRAFT_838222 [Exidia glandulosa HHB12029]
MAKEARKSRKQRQSTESAQAKVCKACQGCRKSKVACEPTADETSCKHCVAQRIPCVTGILRKKAPVPSELADRIKQLEAAVQKLDYQVKGLGAEPVVSLAVLGLSALSEVDTSLKDTGSSATATVQTDNVMTPTQDTLDIGIAAQTPALGFEHHVYYASSITLPGGAATSMVHVPTDGRACTEHRVPSYAISPAYLQSSNGLQDYPTTSSDICLWSGVPDGFETEAYRAFEPQDINDVGLPNDLSDFQEFFPPPPSSHDQTTPW